MHECHETMEDCNQPLHLHGGRNKNTIFAFHFANEQELNDFLVKQGWTSEQQTALYSVGRVTRDQEWAKLSKHPSAVQEDTQEFEDRILFERWAKTGLPLDRSIDGRYTEVDADRAWSIWQAASEALRSVECVDKCAN